MKQIVHKHLTTKHRPPRLARGAFGALALAMMVATSYESSSLKASTAVSSTARQQLQRSDAFSQLKSRNAILFRRGLLDTSLRRDLDTARDDLDFALKVRSASSLELRSGTRIIQFHGPIKNEWIRRLNATGVQIVGYIPNNAYIIRGNAGQLSEVSRLHAGAGADDSQPIQWMGRFEPILKIDPSLDAEMVGEPGQAVAVEVELVNSNESAHTLERIYAVATGRSHATRRFLKFVVLKTKIRREHLLEVASLDDVLFVSPSGQPMLHDERSAQIVAGNLTDDKTQPGGPGYREWLNSKGLNDAGDFIVDVSDTGLDRGFTTAQLIHPDFREGDDQSRLSYLFNYATGTAEDRRGHGSLVASIVGGNGATGREDELGYLYGLGVDPTAKLGVSRIFDSRGNLPFHLSFTDVASAASAAGAQISNNSWGIEGNFYDATAQEFDALTRDAQPTIPGNQEMTFVFSAGNRGPGGHTSSPGLGKNVISVAASENYRPQGTDACDLDGGGAIGPEGADSAVDILRFSAGGPTADGRAKPDLTAPGTHIYGAASQTELYTASGICPGRPFQPPGQTLYTWSSGTSVAAPHVTGAASLVRKYFSTNNLLGALKVPSPAMVKAFLISSATYLTGENAAEDLPGTRQGWGRVNLFRAFDGVSRVLVDQTTVFTESGQVYELRGSVADLAQPLRVSLVWTDAPGMLAGPAIVNDLDLEVKVGADAIHLGNNFIGQWSVKGGMPDGLNNVESVFLSPDSIPHGADGNVIITVRAVNIAGDGVPGNAGPLDQDFALVVYNMTQAGPPPPPNKTPVIDSATYVKKRFSIAGRNFTSAAQVEVNGRIIEREFQFESGTNTLRIKLKYKKLNLVKEADNPIVVIENGERSQPFVLRI